MENDKSERLKRLEARKNLADPSLGERLIQNVRKLVAPKAGKTACESCYVDGVPIFSGSHTDAHRRIADFRAGKQPTNLLTIAGYAEARARGQLASSYVRSIATQHAMPPTPEASPDIPTRTTE